MHAQYHFLVPAALFVTLFIAVLACGALVGLAGLGMQALRAISGARDTKAHAPSTQQVLRLARLPGAVEAETPGDAVPAYAQA